MSILYTLNDMARYIQCRLFLSLESILCAGTSVALSYCFKSKCNDFSLCCGLVHIERDVQAENEETKIELDHQIHRSTSIENLNKV
jgi:hypothetical protein